MNRKIKKTKTSVLASAMDILSVEIQSGDGIANAAIKEAAERLREQDIKREVAHASLEQDRQKFLTAAGVDMFNNANYNALQAANIDNNAINDLNNANIQAYDRTRNPLAEVMNTAGGALVSGGINYGLNQLFAKNEPVADFAWKNPPSLNLFKK